ncbi:MAG: LysM peptidoglycan-binding domain-containing protein [Terriglobia bacterium]
MKTIAKTQSQWQGRLETVLCAALMLCSLLIPAQILRGEEAGGATVQFQFNNNATGTSSNILNNPLFSLAIPGYTNADLRVDTYEFIPNWGLLKTSFDVANTNNSIRPTRGMLELSDYHLGDWKFDIAAGDQPFAAYNIDFGLNSLFNPFAYLRGGRVTTSTDRMSFTVFGGKAAAMNGFFGESLRLSEENIFGARGVFNVSSKLKIGASLMRTTAPENSTDQMIPQSDTLATMDILYQLNPHIQFMGQSSVSRFSGSSDTERPNGTDVSYLFGTKIKGVRGSAEVTWQRLGPNYLPLSFFNLGDREGLFSSADYQLNHKLSLYGAFNQFQTNLLDSHTQTALHINNEFIGARYILRPHSTLNIRVGNASVESKEFSPNFVSSHSHTLDLEFLQQVKSWRFLVRYMDSRDLDFTTAFQRSLRQRMELEVRKTWKNGTNLWVSGGTLREAQQQEQENKHLSLVGSAGFNWNLRPSLSFYSELNWNQDVAVVRTTSFNNTSFNSGVSWALPHGVQFSVNGQYNRSTNKMNLLDFYTVTPENLSDLQNLLLTQQLNRYQFTFRISKTFKWGERPQELLVREGGASALAGKPHEFGNIAGLVFNDIDRNGLDGENESGVSNVTIILDKRVKVPVDEHGRFEFKNVPVGKHTVELDLLTLPATFDAGANTRVAVNVAKRATADVQFPLLELGRVAGKVVLVNGMDSDGLRKEIGETRAPEQPGSNIIILLNETYKVTFTDSDGEFEFSNIPSGEYRVRIDRGTLPEFSTIDSDEVQVIKIAPGGKVSGLKFVVKMNPRPNRRLLVASQILPQPVKAEPNGTAVVNSGARKRVSSEVARNGKSTLQNPNEKTTSVSALTGGKGPSLEDIDRWSKAAGSGMLIHTVRSGETLETLALKYYQTRTKWTLIFNANRNQIDASKRLRPGQELKIPVEPEPVSKLNKTGRGPVKVHVVQPGETLGSLALRYYKTETKWNLIYEANKTQLAASKTLRVGQKLSIPGNPDVAKAGAPDKGVTDTTSKGTASSDTDSPGASAPAPIVVGSSQSR